MKEYIEIAHNVITDHPIAISKDGAKIILRDGGKITINSWQYSFIYKDIGIHLEQYLPFSELEKVENKEEVFKESLKDFQIEIKLYNVLAKTKNIDFEEKLTIERYQTERLEMAEKEPIYVMINDMDDLVIIANRYDLRYEMSKDTLELKNWYRNDGIYFGGIFYLEYDRYYISDISDEDRYEKIIKEKNDHIYRVITGKKFEYLPIYDRSFALQKGISWYYDGKEFDVYYYNKEVYRYFLKRTVLSNTEIK